MPSITAAWLTALAAADLERGAGADTISLRIHDTLAAEARGAPRCGRPGPVARIDAALSGGIFENRLLLERARDALRSTWYATIWSADVPVGKGESRSS